MRTENLLQELKKARNLNGDVSPINEEATEFCADAKCEGPDCRPGASPCIVCHRTIAGIMCPNGHHSMCEDCMTLRVQCKLRHQVVCDFDGCASTPFRDEDLCKSIPINIYNQHIAARMNEMKLENYFRRIEVFMSNLGGNVRKVDENLRNVMCDVGEEKELLKHRQMVLQNMAKGLDRSLAAMSFLVAKQSMECPNIIWMIPIDVKSSNLKQWIRMIAKQKFKAVFLSAHSFMPGHEPFEIEMPRAWIVKIAPWLKLCLYAMKGAVNAYGLPFPMPDLSFPQQYDMMKDFIDSVLETGTRTLMSYCESMMDQGAIPIEIMDKLQPLVGTALKLIAEKANKEKRSQWKSQMVPVSATNDTGNGIVKWVTTEEYERHYKVSR